MFETPVDLARVIYFATANEALRLPPALLDRLRVIRWPAPRPEHLDELLPSILADVIAREHGQTQYPFMIDTGQGVADPPPQLDPTERAAIATHWSGGSIRQLTRLVETALAARRARPFLH